MKVRPIAEFLTDMPSDMVEDDEDIVAFGGRNVIEAIGKMLVDLGYKTSDPIYAGEHGWEMDVEAFTQRFWLQVTEFGGPGVRLLQTEDMIFRLWPNRAPHAEFLVKLNNALRKDARFSEIRWFPKGYRQPGITPSDNPVDP